MYNMYHNHKYWQLSHKLHSDLKRTSICTRIAWLCDLGATENTTGGALVHTTLNKCCILMHQYPQESLVRVSMKLFGYTSTNRSNMSSNIMYYIMMYLVQMLYFNALVHSMNLYRHIYVHTDKDFQHLHIHCTTTHILFSLVYYYIVTCGLNNPSADYLLWCGYGKSLKGFDVVKTPPPICAIPSSLSFCSERTLTSCTVYNGTQYNILSEEERREREREREEREIKSSPIPYWSAINLLLTAY